VDNETRDQAEMAERVSIAVSRRKAFAMAAKLGLGGAALAGGLGSSLAANPPQTAGGLPKKNYKFFFVCHVTLDQFFTPTVYGIQDACAFFGCRHRSATRWRLRSSVALKQAALSEFLGPAEAIAIAGSDVVQIL